MRAPESNRAARSGSGGGGRVGGAAELGADAVRDDLGPVDLRARQRQRAAQRLERRVVHRLVRLVQRALRRAHALTRSRVHTINACTLSLSLSLSHTHTHTHTRAGEHSARENTST